MNHDKLNAKIMIVDDEEDITSFLNKALENHGFQVTVFNDPLEALSKFQKDFYNLVLLDIKMPNMDGFQLYDQLKKIDPLLKICFMTAFEVYIDALRKMFPESYSSICFIKKPFAVNEFINKINKEMVEGAE